jgi:molybdenum cofactor cytidylyltransferase
MTRFAAVILAAGMSSRMGSNKLLADIEGRPLITRTVERVQASGVDEVIVVTGHQASAVRAAVTGVQLVHNPEFTTGLASSLRAGIEAADGFDAAFICLGDMPLIRPEDLKRMMAAFTPERNIVAPAKMGQLGNPVLWGKVHFAELMALSGDKGARAILEAQRGKIIEVEVSDDSIMLDADTPEALAKIRSAANSGS